MPLLHKFAPGELEISLLDIHAESLASVEWLISHFGFDNHRIQTVQGDACNYHHPVALHLVIAETMQLCLAQRDQPTPVQSAQRIPLARVFTLLPELAAAQMRDASVNPATSRRELPTAALY